MRSEVKAALATSTVRERKLHFASFMQGRGGRILSAAYQATGTSPAAFQAAVSQMRDVEFYMPVLAHRQKWTGDENLLVGVTVNKNEVAVAFTPDGRRLVLDRYTPPATPVLILTYVETDFREQIALNLRGKSALSCAMISGETLEAAAQRCNSLPTALSPPRSGPSAVPNLLSPGTISMRPNLADQPTVLGLYVSFVRVMDASEWWTAGDPELEMHVTGKRNGPAGNAIDYQCSGEHANDPADPQPGIRDQSYVYDQNGNFWSGDVRILNSSQLDSLQAAEPDGFNVTIWEDDQISCETHENNSTLLENALAATAEAARGVNAVRVGVRNNADPETLVVTIAGYVRRAITLLLGDDDLVGTLVAIDSTAYAGQYPGNTHIIFKDASFNGRATMYVKKTSRSVYLSGDEYVPAGSSGQWSNSATGTGGAVTYAWSIDGTLLQDGSSSAFSYATDPASSGGFVVQVTATDSYGTVSSADMPVTIGSAGGGCGAQVVCNRVLPLPLASRQKRVTSNIPRRQ